VRSNSHYQEEYQIPIKLYLQDSLDELVSEVYSNGVLLINQNVKVKCEVDHTDIVSAYSQKSNNKYLCVLRPKNSNSPLPSTLTLTITVSADSYNSYQVTKRFEIPVMSHFKVINPASKHVTLYKDSRSVTFEVNSNNDF